MFKKRHWFYLPAYLCFFAAFGMPGVTADLAWWRLLLAGALLGGYIEFATEARKPATKKIEIIVTGEEYASDVLREISDRLGEAMQELENG